MRSIYLSHTFGDRDRDLVSEIETLIRSHGLIVAHSRHASGGQLTNEIRKHIANADALVALKTKRTDDPDSQTHPFVIMELDHARSLGRHAVALYEDGVAIDPGDQGHEHIAYDRQSPLAAFLKLSAIIGDWKREIGRLIKMQLMPEQIAIQIGQSLAAIRCEYRYQFDDQDTEWKDAKVKKEVGGVFGYIRLPDNATMVQIRASGGGLSCESPYTPLSTPITLE